MTDELIKRLKEAAQAATPQNLDTAQTVERYEDGSHITCPTCDGEGYAELNSDFCNYDGKAIGVQFYGIGPEHLAAEAYFRAASPAAVLELIALIEQQAAALEAANARIAELEADRDAMPIPDAGAPIEGHWASAMADPLEVPGYIRAALAQPLEAQADARWQPIETAPKDGTPIVIACIDDDTVFDVCNGHFEVLLEDEDDGPWDIRDGEPWCSYVGRQAGTYFCCWLPGKEWERGWKVPDDFEYTHWMPLPAAPAALSQKAGEQG